MARARGVGAWPRLSCGVCRLGPNRVLQTLKIALFVSRTHIWVNVAIAKHVNRRPLDSPAAVVRGGHWAV
jgi:hypothetical protein